MKTWQEVISGTARYSVEAADRLEWFAQLPADSLDLVIGSPPYEAARTYGVGFNLRGQAWVDWMVATFQAALRACKGLVAFVLEGQTRQFRWSATPALLMADLHRAGVNLRRPVIFHRVGIPGSGGPDYLRADTEYIVCASRPGRLPWSDNTACGHPPKWAPGGAMSHRLSDGARVNQWGHPIESGATVTEDGGVVRSKGKRPSHRLAGIEEEAKLVVPSANRYGMTGNGPESKLANGTKRKPSPSSRRVVRGSANGDTLTSDSYDPPVIANPGNLLSLKVGGGLMGNDLAHLNEAPFPLGLPEFFVRSFCPPGGIVADCFSGSGSTLEASLKWGRRFVGADVRQSQVDLSLRRAATVQPMLMET